MQKWRSLLETTPQKQRKLNIIGFSSDLIANQPAVKSMNSENPAIKKNNADEYSTGKWAGAVKRRMQMICTNARWLPQLTNNVTVSTDSGDDEKRGEVFRGSRLLPPRLQTWGTQEGGICKSYSITRRGELILLFLSALRELWRWLHDKNGGNVTSRNLERHRGHRMMRVSVR